MKINLEFYKNIGYELMDELAFRYGIIEPGGSGSAYQTLQMSNGMTIRFTPWRGEVMPCYIILFNKNKYIFELDLSMISYIQDKFTWHLKKPRSEKNKKLYTQRFGEVTLLDDNYRDNIDKVKKTLKSGVKVPRIGYNLIENANWKTLCIEFLGLMDEVIKTHSGKGEKKFTFKEARNDDGEYVTRRHKSRRDQFQFRLNLMNFYDYRCAISNTGVSEVLEAAHIEPHSERGKNLTGNGILLRSDIHRLFDAELIAINPKNLRIEISKDLNSTEYAKLQGKKIRARIDTYTPDQLYPDQLYLKKKWSRWIAKNRKK